MLKHPPGKKPKVRAHTPPWLAGSNTRQKGQQKKIKYQSQKLTRERNMARCLTILEITKQLIFLGEQRGVYRFGEVKEREETTTFAIF